MHLNIIVMPVQTRSQACSVQPTEQVTSPRANTPRRVLQSPNVTLRRRLRSRQGNAGVIINRDEGGPSFIVAGGQIPDSFLISRCANARCKTCPNWIREDSIVSNVTNKTYSFINHTVENINCHTQNIVYLLTCNECNIQYVGETIQPFNERMNGHRSSKAGCQHILDHKDVCSDHNYSYQILEKLPGSGYDIYGHPDVEMRALRKSKEESWIKTLRTLYPYGLNEKLCGTVTDSTTVDTATGKIFPPLPRTGDRPIRSRENRNNKTSAVSCDDFFSSLQSLLLNYRKSSFNTIRILLNNTKKKVLKEIAFYIMERSKYNFDEKHEQCYLYILDIIDTKLYREPAKIVKQTRKNVCTIRFINNGIDDIRLPQIFNSPEVIAVLPEILQEKDNIPSVAMKLDPPIRNKILNYRQTLLALNIEIDDGVDLIPSRLDCECILSPFCDPHHKHIITGDLRVIGHPKLRKLFSKGLNYREKKSTNYNKCLKEIKFSIRSFISSTVDRYQNITPQHLKNWEDLVLLKVRSKVRNLKTEHTFQQTKPILDDDDVKTYLDELHNNFVIVPIDKASNNIAIVCKRFYVSRLFEELGISGNTSDTYKLATKSKYDIIINNLSLCSKYGLELTDSQMTLPFMYWMPKMHYSPSRARFIVASSACSSKPLSQAVSKVFKLLFHQVQNFHAKSTFYKNYNRFWVIENSSPIIERLNSLNRRKKAQDISTYDFSTLYTKLQHSDLVRVLKGIIDFSQKGGRKRENGNRKYVSFSKRDAFWCKKRCGKMCFSIPELKVLTAHLITETYFEFGNLVFRQSIGIPMGIDPAPFWANLYLHKYEYDHITSLIRSDKRRALMTYVS